MSGGGGLIREPEELVELNNSLMKETWVMNDPTSYLLIILFSYNLAHFYFYLFRILMDRTNLKPD